MTVNDTVVHCPLPLSFLTPPARDILARLLALFYYWIEDSYPPVIGEAMQMAAPGTPSGSSTGMQNEQY